jgi:hypothetical protein
LNCAHSVRPNVQFVEVVVDFVIVSAAGAYVVVLVRVVVTVSSVWPMMLRDAFALPDVSVFSTGVIVSVRVTLSETDGCNTITGGAGVTVVVVSDVVVCATAAPVPISSAVAATSNNLFILLSLPRNRMG